MFEEDKHCFSYFLFSFIWWRGGDGGGDDGRLGVFDGRAEEMLRPQQ